VHVIDAPAASDVLAQLIVESPGMGSVTSIASSGAVPVFVTV
jgi:hypothetical protein